MLCRLGLNIDILPPATFDLSGHNLVLAPGAATLSNAFLGALKAHESLPLGIPVELRLGAALRH